MRVECALVHDSEVRFTIYDLRIESLRACGLVCIMAGVGGVFLRLFLYVLFFGSVGDSACAVEGCVVGCVRRLVRQKARRHTTHDISNNDAPDGSHP